MNLTRRALLGLFALLIGAGSIVRADDAPATQAANAGPVDFRKLKEWLPAELAGIKRSDASGERTQLGEFRISTASGTYEKSGEEENPPSIRVEVMDYAGASGLGEAVSAWKALEVDRESDSGYERTTKIAGFPAYEQYETESKHGQLQVWVGNRFSVTVTSDNVPVEHFRKLGEQLRFSALGELR